ncbi:hypothetical protein ACVR1I_04515 [Streptococcus cameli]
MKNIIMFYMGVYVLVVAASAIYSVWKTKKMSKLRLALTLIFLLIVSVSLFFYGKGYHPIQMVAFALSFTSISSIFFYNGVRAEDKFTLVFALSMVRLLVHLQLLGFLYFFR